MSTPQSSGTGLPSNVSAALSYVLGALTGILFYVLEPKDRFVRFHAVQSIILTVVWIAVAIVISIVTGVLALIPVVGWIIGALLGLVLALVLPLGGLILWLYLLLKTYQGANTRLPYIAPLADRYAEPTAA